jgi:hypothetical protein
MDWSWLATADRSVAIPAGGVISPKTERTTQGGTNPDMQSAFPPVSSESRQERAAELTVTGCVLSRTAVCSLGGPDPSHLARLEWLPQGIQRIRPNSGASGRFPISLPN